MVTDKERREVARKLRETGEELGSSALLWYHIAKILGVRTATDGKTACDMLADLIEPSESGQNRDRNQDSVQKESPIVQIEHECDRDALLALADRMETMAGMGASLTADGLEMAAVSIREALGVKS